MLRQLVIRTEGISVGVIKMLGQQVGFGPVGKLNMTRTKGISAGLKKVLCQLVGLGLVERTNIKLIENDSYRRYI